MQYSVYDLEGHFICSYMDIKALADDLEVDTYRIKNAIQFGSRVRNRQIRQTNYNDESDIGNYYEVNNRQFPKEKVVLLYDDGSICDMYTTYKECCEDLGLSIKSFYKLLSIARRDNKSFNYKGMVFMPYQVYVEYDKERLGLERKYF